MTLKGKDWRIGLMGVDSTGSNVLLLLSAREPILKSEAFPCGSGVPADDVYRKNPQSRRAA